METELAELADITRAEIRRGYRNAGIGSAVGVGLGAALVAVIHVVLLGGGPVRLDPGPFLNGAGFALIGAATGMMISSNRINRRMRMMTATDPSTWRRIDGVVLRGKSHELTLDEQRRAVQFVAIVTRSLPFRAVQSAALFAALILGQVSNIFFPPRGVDPHFLMSFVMLAVMVVLLAVLLPPTLVRARRARRWAAMHAGL
jgi:hypothetical protein